MFRMGRLARAVLLTADSDFGLQAKDWLALIGAGAAAVSISAGGGAAAGAGAGAAFCNSEGGKAQKTRRPTLRKASHCVHFFIPSHAMRRPESITMRCENFYTKITASWPYLCFAY